MNPSCISKFLLLCSEQCDVDQQPVSYIEELYLTSTPEYTWKDCPYSEKGLMQLEACRQ